MYKIRGGDGKEYGPVSADVVRQWIAEGRANERTLVLPDGHVSWVQLGTLGEFYAVDDGATGALAVRGEALTDGAKPGLALAVPAGWALTVIGWLGVVMCVGMIAYFAVVGVGQADYFGLMKAPASEAERIGQLIGFYASFVVGIGWAIFIAVAGARMRRLKSWGLVLTAGILCLLPCCGTQFPLCLLSFPVGVWVIIVLVKVKQSFS